MLQSLLLSHKLDLHLLLLLLQLRKLCLLLRALLFQCLQHLLMLLFFLLLLQLELLQLRVSSCFLLLFKQHIIKVQLFQGWQHWLLLGLLLHLWHCCCRSCCCR